MPQISPHAIIQTADLGRNIRVDEFAIIRPGVRVGNDVIIHPHVVINEDVIVDDGVEIFPGALLGKAPKGSGALARQPAFEKKLIIGPNCSIGPHAVIFYDVEIGDNTLIETGTVVMRDVPSGTVAMGIPRQGVVHHLAKENIMVHDSALLESCHVGDGTRIWAHTHILPGAQIGADCNICDQTFIENDVIIGDRVTVKSGDDTFITFDKSRSYYEKCIEKMEQRGREPKIAFIFERRPMLLPVSLQKDTVNFPPKSFNFISSQNPISIYVKTHIIQASVFKISEDHIIRDYVNQNINLNRNTTEQKTSLPLDKIQG